MKNDGRLKKFQENYKPKEKGIQIKKICENCGKEFYLSPHLLKYRKNCSRNCINKFRSKNKIFYGNQYINLNEVKYVPKVMQKMW
jgi:hypothetical protein